MSAATMMALAADEICMARHSTLGPTDPQFVLRTNTGDIRYVSAHALNEEFERAKELAKNDPSSFTAWAPIIGQYPPGILAQSKHSMELTTNLVKVWLRKYMLADDKYKARKARVISKYFSGGQHHSHGRPLMREELINKGLNIKCMEDDQDEQDLIMSSYHAANHMLGGTIVTKVIEGDSGRGYLRMFRPPNMPTGQ